MNEELKIKFNYLLPIGSIIQLKNAKHSMMIIGHNISNELDIELNGSVVSYKGRKPKIYQYYAVPWPEGDAITGRFLYFDHNDIGKVFFTGFIDDEDGDLKEKIEESVRKINEEQN